MYCKDILEQIKKIYHSWKKETNKIKLNYYYNFEQELIDESQKEEIKNDKKKNLFKNTYDFLKSSSRFYKISDQYQETKKTRKKIKRNFSSFR
ncbi:hypothetical protein [Candidatus Coxiella mudrowiae]|uniref:hypothetical protein n=1 Tax=Candidatus Coxiella mudrowiae TaxID=2054173 RepID=UPI000C291F8D|nr:hypothetical protein [Candidatus Coxiella mudrowiae]